jgi:hypothetical protein
MASILAGERRVTDSYAMLWAQLSPKMLSLEVAGGTFRVLQLLRLWSSDIPLPTAELVKSNI